MQILNLQVWVWIALLTESQMMTMQDSREVRQNNKNKQIMYKL